MNPMNAAQLAEIVNGQCSETKEELTFNSVSTDSRSIQQGQAFFAILGENFDGHDYALAAIEKGASCVVVEHHIDMPSDGNSAVIVVQDVVRALGQLAAWYRQRLSAKVVAVTGSVGKTTTRHILHQILSCFFKCHQAKNSFNNHIGVPLTLLSTESDAEILLTELGSNHLGEIQYLSEIVKPDIGLITMVAPTHLEGFGSIENIIREKSAIAEGMCQDGILFVNGDQPELTAYAKSHYDVHITTFGTEVGCDIVGENLKAAGQCGSLTIEGQTIQVSLPGMGNLKNIISAWGICRHFGISLDDFTAAVRTLKPAKMRLAMENIGPLMILNDCYNANPTSMNNALSCLRSAGKEAGKRTVFVVGCMGELGPQAASLHEQLGRDAASSEIAVLLAAGPFANQILEGAASASQHSIKMHAYEKTDELCDNLDKWIKPDDIILVKGSRTAGLERAVDRLRELFENQ